MDAKTIRHVATLAKLRFEEEAAEQFAEEFAGVIEFVEQLSEVNTEGVVPTYHGNDLMNVFRPDEVVVTDHTQALLANAPTAKDGFIQVPVIIESEEA